MMPRGTFLVVIVIQAHDFSPQWQLKYILMHFPDCANLKKSF